MCDNSGMYSPTTRLLTILELLQSRGQMSGPELARRLEVTVRSIRRYIVMLQDLGIPIEAERGPQGAYRLQRGFKMPPLMTTDAEAVALTLGLVMLREFNLPVDAAAVAGALAKIERILPERLHQQAGSLQEAIAFNVELPAVRLQRGLLEQLSTAVHRRQRVHLRYRAFEGRVTDRDFDAYGIVFNQGYWYVTGRCHLRRAVRTFRLDRIERLEPRAASFERPEGFDPLKSVLDSLSGWSTPESIEVLLHTTLEVALEHFPPGTGTLTPTSDGVLLRRPPYELEWIALLLASLDFPAEVIKPRLLRDNLRSLAERARRLAGDTRSPMSRAKRRPSGRPHNPRR